MPVQTKATITTQGHAPAVIALVRILIGVMMVVHGSEVFEPEKMNMYTGWFIGKQYSYPAAWAYAGKIAELVAGIGFVLGFMFRWACVIAAMAFLGIIFLLGDKGKIFHGDQHPFLFVVFCVLYWFLGAGKWSVDSLRGKN